MHPYSGYCQKCNKYYPVSRLVDDHPQNGAFCPVHDLPIKLTLKSVEQVKKEIHLSAKEIGTDLAPVRLLSRRHRE